MAKENLVDKFRSKSGSTKARLASLAWLLDNSIKIPGTKFRIGLDSVIGLVPILGDTIGLVISSYIVAEGIMARAPVPVLLRVIANFLLEWVVGLVPLFGDVFDMFWKANMRNFNLLADYLDRPEEVAQSSRLRIVLVILFIALLLLMMVFGSIYLFIRLVKLI